MRSLMLATICFIFYCLPAFADTIEYETRMIIVHGAMSKLMDGDSFANFNKPLNYNDRRVLPFFLKAGWNIRSVHVNEKSREDNLYGYVVIERKITIDDK